MSRSRPSFCGHCYICARLPNKKNNMRIQRTVLLPLVVLGVTLAAPASAAPIVFDISATISYRSYLEMPAWTNTVDHSLDGQVVTAQFVIDPDLFATPPVVSTEEFDDMTFRSLAGGPSGISTSLTIGGVPIDTSPFSQDRSEVAFYDSYGWITGCGGACGSMTPDQYSIRSYSEEFGAGGLSGFSLLQFGAAESVDPAIPESGMTWLDFTQPVTLDLLLTLPTENGSYPSSIYWSEGTYDCTGQCRQTGMWNTSMSITSLTRSTMSVPEPGTLGLLVAGFAGLMLVRRRQGAPV